MAKSLIIALLVLAGCSRPVPFPPVESFSGTNAFHHVAQLVAFGPRPSGSEALTRSAGYLQAQLEAAGLEVELQEFRAGTPTGPVLFRNVIGRTKSGGGKIVILGSHYDTKRLANFVGANDAGSSSGALLELARVLAGQRDLWFVFFDGEEAVNEYGPADGLWGSKFLVETLKGENKLRSVQAMILLDMVGDRDLKITMPANSTPELVQRTFAAAESLGWREKFSYVLQEILDDHEPFRVAGVPAVNLIDFEFGSAPGLNDYWHTERDTLDKISPRSLEIVGRTTLRLLEQLPR